MFAFIEHGQPHNHHGGENTITLSHASVRRPCQKLTKSLPKTDPLYGSARPQNIELNRFN